MGEIADRLRLQAVQLLAEADLVAALEAPPAPEPAPVPVPAPEPTPAPTPAPSPQISAQPINLSRVVCFIGWHESSRYERYQRLDVWSGERVSQAIDHFLKVNGA